MEAEMACVERNRTLWSAWLMALSLAFGLWVQPGRVAAQESVDVGLVNQMNGAVTYLPGNGSGAGASMPTRAFMRVRLGDQFTVAAGASLRLIYFSSGRQESWQGPASLRAGRLGSELQSGQPPVVVALPVSVPQRMARVPDLVQGARLGGIVVRGGARARTTAAVSPELERARGLYRTMREATSADDVTPELYLLSVLQEHGQVDEIESVAREMLKRQPDTPEVKELAKWAQDRASAPR
jgi:hypothetical protein